jgi:hypothetical protein
VRLNQLVADNLEYRNSDSVFYSPLLGLPAPYFRHARSIEIFHIVVRMSQELNALDSHQAGFVPVGLFRSVLEHELKMKTKIVDDFIENLKQPTKGLDVNAHANNVASQLDYIVLLRKLLLCAETRDENMEPMEAASERGSSQFDMSD